MDWLTVVLPQYMMGLYLEKMKIIWKGNLLLVVLLLLLLMWEQTI